MLIHFGKNTKGRDFVVGDIHGCFDRLMAFLKVVNFDFSIDRLFSVGDLTDRGPNSDQVSDWLLQPWFHPVRGNHDQMVVDATDPYSTVAAQNLFMNGGQWFFNLNHIRQKEIAFELDSLPLMIEIETNHGLVGIVHADVIFSDWDVLKSRRHEVDIQNYTVWDRGRHKEMLRTPVKGIDFVVVGHNVVHQAERLGNIINIDTGAFLYPKNKEYTAGFTLLNLNDMEFFTEAEYVQS